MFLGDELKLDIQFLSTICILQISLPTVQLIIFFSMYVEMASSSTGNHSELTRSVADLKKLEEDEYLKPAEDLVLEGMLQYVLNYAQLIEGFPSMM